MAAPRFVYQLKGPGGDSQAVTFVGNHLAWHALEEHFKCSIFEWIDRWMQAETLSDTHRLLYHLTESHRDRRGQMTLRNFLELLPDDPEEWANLRIALIECVSKTFFYPRLMKTSLLIVERALVSRQARRNEWIGTSDGETPPSLDFPETNSGESSPS